MRVLIIDPAGAGLDIAIRMQQDGHDVVLVIKDTTKSEWIGHGLVRVERDYAPWLRWADLIVMADNVKYLRDLDAFRKESNVLFIGPSSEAADWELDREKGMEVFRKAGIKTSPYKEFTDFDEAIAYVKKEDRRFVSKPSGDADKALSYVAKNPADLVYMLERWKKNGKYKAMPFILQEFIGGIEMAVGNWFGPGGFSTGWCENFEFKKLMNGDLGVATGEQGTVLRYVRKSKLADKVLKPLEGPLLKLGYTGYVDVNCIIDEKGTPWPLEFTMRPGWPTFNIQMALHDGDHAEWLTDLASGRDPKNFRMDEVATGVVLSIPDYPYSHMTRKDVIGVPVYGLTDSLWKNAHLCEMMMADAPNSVAGKIVTMPTPCSAGDYLLVMSATGATIRASASSCYRRLKRLTVPNSPMWRTDIGGRLKKQLPELQAMGYAIGMEY